MAVNIIKQTNSHNTNYIGKRAIKYIVIHYTAGVSSKKGSARNEAMWFQNPQSGGSADFIVDDAEIIQYSPDIDTYLTWHSGVDYSNGSAPYWGKCTNGNSIGIEICSTNTNYESTDPANSPKWSFTNAAVSNAVELVKYLMAKYNIPAENVIRHWDVCRKPCPGILGWNTHRGNTEEKWLDFKKRIGAKASAATTAQAKASTIYRVQCGAFSVRKNAEAFAKQLQGKGFKDAFVVKTNAGISDIFYKVQCGAFSVKANAEALKNKLKAAGCKDAFILSTETKNSETKSVDELAHEVLEGKWGNGSDRKTRLTAAGYDFNAVQARVNALLKV